MLTHTGPQELRYEVIFGVLSVPFLPPTSHTRASASGSLSMNFASAPPTPDLLEPGIIGVSAQNRRIGLDSDRAQLFNTRFRIYAQVAQSVEQRTENPRVGGSIPPLGTI